MGKSHSILIRDDGQDDEWDSLDDKEHKDAPPNGHSEGLYPTYLSVRKEKRNFGLPDALGDKVYQRCRDRARDTGQVQERHCEYGSVDNETFAMHRDRATDAVEQTR